MTHKYLLVFIIVFSIAACSKKEQEAKLNYSENLVKHFVQWDSPCYKVPAAPVTEETSIALHTLLKDTVVRPQGNSRDFNRFRQVATAPQLIKLTSDKNPFIRCHAYNALVANEYPEIHRICFEHFNDTLQKVYMDTGKGVMRLSVRTWMIWQLRSESGAKYKFERNLYRHYLSEYPDFKKARQALENDPAQK